MNATEAEYIWPWAGGLECSVAGCMGDVTHRISDVLYCRAHLPEDAGDKPISTVTAVEVPALRHWWQFWRRRY